MNWKETEPLRLYLYGTMAPLLALLALLGVISEAHIPYYIALGAAVLGVGFGGEAARSKVTPVK